MNTEIETKIINILELDGIATMHQLRQKTGLLAGYDKDGIMPETIKHLIKTVSSNACIHALDAAAVCWVIVLNSYMLNVVSASRRYLVTTALKSVCATLARKQVFRGIIYLVLFV